MSEWMLEGMENWMQELRYAARQLRRSPGFTLIAIITLALGIGGTAAVFSVVQSALLQPLPYPEPNRLVGVAFTYPLEKANAEETGSSADFLSEHTDIFSSSAVIDDSGANVNFFAGNESGAHATQVTSVRVSEEYFRTLGIQPMLGRSFTAEDDRPGGARRAVLTHPFLQSQSGLLLSIASILMAALVASWLPARRAASTEPMRALRAE